MINKYLDITFYTKNEIFKNSFFGIITNILQNILLSIFFILVARHYSTEDFGNYIISNTIYSFILGFSTLGLGNWFIRELINVTEKNKLINQFLKIQIIIGITFLVINNLVAYSLYENETIRYLSLIFGFNIVFDNIIYVIKYINIANGEQHKSFVLTTIESILKLALAGLLLITKINIEVLCILLIALRITTLVLFIKLNSTNKIQLKEIAKLNLSYNEVKNIIKNNWAFIIIGSISIINWRIGNIFVSKYLTIKDVVNYEISFKLLSIIYIIPIIISNTVYPVLVNKINTSIIEVKKTYRNIFILYSLFGFLSYTLIYAYADKLIPLLFGNKYLDTAQYCKEMFLVILIFPTLYLQANLLVAMRLEKIDMICNLVSLSINVICCALGLLFFKTLTVVNYGIFLSFLFFHVIQDFVLIKNKMSTIKDTLIFYLSIIIGVLTFQLSSKFLFHKLTFIMFWLIILVFAIFRLKKATKFLNPA